MNMTLPTSIHHNPWWRGLALRPSDWVPFFLYVGVLADYLVIYHAMLPTLRTAIVVGALIALAASDRWEHWRYDEQTPHWLRIVLFILNIVLVEVVVQQTAEGIGAFLYAILPLRASLWFGRTAGVLAGLTILASYVVQTFSDPLASITPLKYLLSDCILFGTAIAFVMTISYLAIEDRRARQRAELLLANLEQTHQALAASAAQAADLAVAAERNRIARDIHDSLGHYLTALNIQLEKALAFQHHDRTEMRNALITSKRLAHEALADTRRSVGLLRDRISPFSLATMLHELAEAGQVPSINLTIEGDETLATLAQRLMLYRIAQEGLTNIRRHAHASRADLLLRFGVDGVLLRISDDGVGLAGSVEGFGMSGIRERVALSGGALAVESPPAGGTLLTVTLPIAMAIEGREP